MIKLFAGYDPRESIGFHVFVQSVIARASQPVEFVPLAAMGLAEGSNAFTLSRFLIPYLCGFEGHAIFMDASDMLVQGDVADLYRMTNGNHPVQVVKHPDYKTKHRTKYRGTDMECPNMDYPRKNWASVMLINCEHEDWSRFTPDHVASVPALDLLQLKHCSSIGDLPDHWNRLVDEGQPLEEAKLIHWTAGSPMFEHYRDAPGAELWQTQREEMNRGC